MVAAKNDRKHTALSREGDRATPDDPALRVGLRAYRKALELGVVLRPLGDILYWMPPYCVDDAQLEMLANATRDVIDAATGAALADACA